MKDTVCGHGVEQAPELRAEPWPIIVSILQMASQKLHGVGNRRPAFYSSATNEVLVGRTTREKMGIQNKTLHS